MLPSDLSVKPPFFEVILPPITSNIKRVERYDRRVKKNCHNLRMLTVAFSRTDLQLPTPVAVIPKTYFVILK